MAINFSGSNREPLSTVAPQDLDDMRRAHVLVTDSRRSRPRWFDGRFLAARDLANEQNYFLVRQSDLGRAGGSGVIEGLMAGELTDVQTQVARLGIGAGYGFTDTGEMVVVPEDLVVDPADIPEMQRLDAAFGLQEIPSEPGRSRTGLYVIALRPVEWTANPISAYPTSLTGERTVQDGDIIEGAVVTLVPYADGGSDDWDARRARVAREIFLCGRDQGLASGALPLALVALRGNQIVWLDPYLARRDAGAQRPAGMDFGFGQRALREAQLLQYDNHLADVLNTVGSGSFEAVSCFNALPPVGRLPALSVNADALTQQYFPPSMTVEFSFVPEDELPAIIEESLLLPPLDLQADADTLAGWGVIILAPLTRDEFKNYYDTLAGRTITLTAPVLQIKGNPRLLAFSINAQRQMGLADVAADDEVDAASAEWTQLISTAQAQKLFWYVRRRHMPSAANIAGAAVDAMPAAQSNPYELSRFLKENPDAKKHWETIRKNGGPETKSLLKRFRETRLLNNKPMVKELLAKAAAATDAGEEDVVRALAPAANPRLGKGLELMAKSSPAFVKGLARDAAKHAGALVEVDRLIREAPEAKRKEVFAAVKEAFKTPEKFTEAVAKLRTKYKGRSS